MGRDAGERTGRRGNTAIFQGADGGPPICGFGLQLRSHALDDGVHRVADLPEHHER